MRNTKFVEKPVPTETILVNSTEAARLLAISPRTLWTLTQSGEIPSLKIGKSVRYHRDILNQWAKKRLTGTEADATNEEVDQCRA